MAKEKLKEQPDVKSFLSTLTWVDDLKRMREGKRWQERKIINKMIRAMKDWAWNLYFIKKHKLASVFMDAQATENKTKRKKDVLKAEQDTRNAFNDLIEFFSVPMRIMDYVKPKS